MKPTSVIALIVAAVIIIVGVVTCFVANGIAERDGTPLFAESRGDDYINTIDLTDSGIIKISLNFTDADVNIYGSSATSYIEFVNFRETFYSLSQSSTTVSFSELPDFSSLLRFWENGFSFKGMRYLFNPRTYDDSRMKAVNIYLSSDCEIKQFDISADRSAVSLENLSCNADYVFKVDDLTLYSSSVVSNSMLKVGAVNGTDGVKKAKIEFSGSSFASLVINADELSLNGTVRDVFTTDLTCLSGSIDLSLPHYTLSAPPADQKINITTSGRLFINGEEKASPLEYDDTEETVQYLTEISAGSADVSLSELSFRAADDPAEEGAAE